MVTLSKIYTRSGDEGTTRLGDNSEVSKTSPRVACYGATDEVNCVIGLVLACDLPPRGVALLRTVQNDLFDLGADLCLPEEAEGGDQALRVTGAQVERLEAAIDEINAGLEPLNSFVLPGGSSASAWLHMARAVCRRAEVSVWALRETVDINDNIALYLNRLSDLLFVMARDANGRGRGDVLWDPGRFAEETE